MVNPVSGAVIAAVLVLAVAGVLWSWSRRRRRQAGLALPAPVDPGAVLAAEDGLHLATTFAGRPLDRVVVAGLGFRSRGRLALHERALVLDLAGAAPVVLPIGALTGAGTGSWALDRGVERGGLLVVGWALAGPDGPVPVESAFRLDAAAQDRLLAALREHVPAVPDPLEVRDADRPT